jgi:hypothetical protein
LKAVEHACYQCGASVEDGTAFCPQCSAPQIRVGGDLSSEPIAGSLPSPIPVANSTGIQWSQALPAAAQAGLISAVLMFIPFAGFGLGMAAAGILAVLFYRRRIAVGEITSGMGARLGALSGTLGFGIFAVFTAIELLVFHSGGELRAAMLEAIQQSAARSADPQAQQLLEYLKSPAGLTLMMGVGLAVMLVIFLIFSSLGGALGAVLLRRKGRM